MKNIVISTGGTGGHLIPAQQLAQRLKSQNVIFMGKGLRENYNFDKKKYLYKDISSGSISRKKIFLSIFSILKGFLQSLYFFIKKFNPDVIIGFGSYHSFPVLLAGRILKKPIIIFESNSSLGKVNGFFAKKAKILASQFPLKYKYKNTKMVPFLPWINIEKIEKIDARNKLKLNEDLFTILIFGGSAGADFINKNIVKIIKDLKSKNVEFQIIHLCGNNNKEEIKKAYQELKISFYVNEYEKEMKYIYASSDLAICRSGAATIAELIFYEIPSVLIPYPFSSKKHQEKNAYFMQEVIKGSSILLQKDFENIKMMQKIYKIIKEKKYMEMKENLANFKKQIEGENRKCLSQLIFEE